MKEEHWFI